MKKYFLFIPALMLVGAGCAQRSAQTNAPAPAASLEAAAPAAPASRKLADQEYASYAYLISSDTLSADAVKALTGFKMTKKALPDGTVQYTLKALEPDYKDQQYVLKAGEQLYFIEKFLKDDDLEKNEDRGMRDDLAVVVDADGNVVGEPALFQKAE